MKRPKQPKRGLLVGDHPSATSFPSTWLDPCLTLQGACWWIQLIRETFLATWPASEEGLAISLRLGAPPTWRQLGQDKRPHNPAFFVPQVMRAHIGEPAT
jgi:hypothetical protein